MGMLVLVLCTLALAQDDLQADGTVLLTRYGPNSHAFVSFTVPQVSRPVPWPFLPAAIRHRPTLPFIPTYSTIGHVLLMLQLTAQLTAQLTVRLSVPSSSSRH